jgi:methionyl-tRNA formyltransferase
MSRFRIAAFVSGGPIALAALEALADAHELAVIVRPPVTAARRIMQLFGRDRDDVTRWARVRGIPVTVEGAARIRSFRPEIGCIATYPRRIDDDVLAAAGKLVVNLHTSLLPRHRGPNPLFWTYHAGDLSAGVTIHVATSRLDAGKILRTESFPVARGESVVDVHARCAALGARLLADVVTRAGVEWPIGHQQDEASATTAPSPRPGRSYAKLETWTCEQAWHFLAGLFPRYRDPLTDTVGQPVRYARVEGFEVRTPREAPGSVTRDGTAWAAWTRDGVVHLSAGG